MGDLDSLYLKKSSQWAPYYSALLDICGDTVQLINFGDQKNAGAVNAATFTGMKKHASGLAPVWTPNEALSAWDTPFDLTLESNWLGLAPKLTTNGTDEEIDTPDNDYYFRDDNGSAEKLSVGFWVAPANISGFDQIFAQYDASSGSELRVFNIGMDDASVTIRLWDESANAHINSKTNSLGLVAGQMSFCVMTYNGDTLNTGLLGYIDGALSTMSASGSGVYVGMENLATKPQLFTRLGTSANELFFAGEVLGGPWGPFMTQTQLTAEQIADLYQRMRLGLGV